MHSNGYKIRNPSSRIPAVLPVVVIILLAMLIRTRINFPSELIPGINGGYYPLLVRNLLEYGSIRYPDAPLVYWIQAFISVIIRLFSGIDTDQAVLLASRMFDSFIPPLTCIPVFLAARHQLKEKQGSGAFILIIAAFSVLYLSYLMILTSEMQKNAAGLLWVACFLYSVSRINPENQRKYLLISLLFLLLTALTHIGCFIVAFLFTLIYGTVHLAGSTRRIRPRMILIALAIFAVLILISLAVLIRDPVRMQRIMSFYLNPLRIFESPYLLILLSGQQVYSGFLFHNFLLMNVLAISGLTILLANRKNLSRTDLTTGLSLSALSLFLCSPLIGIEWALRYYLMAFLPVALQYIYVYKSLTHNLLKNILSSLLFLITFLSVLAAFNAKRNPSIDSGSYADLQRLKQKTTVNRDDLIIARHGLEWWTGWVMHCRTGKEYCLRPEDWDKYPNIYLLRQKSGNNYPGQQGSGQFAELPVAPAYEKILSNESFDFYRLSEPADNQFYPGELPLIQGLVRSAAGDMLVISSQGYRQPVRLGPETRYILCSPSGIRPGMRADIWGKRVPFSLNIRAERVRAY